MAKIVTDVLPNDPTEQVAKDFIANIENDLAARDTYIKDNLQKCVWKQLPPHKGQSVYVWAYGPDIPGTQGQFIYRLARLYYTADDDLWHFILKNRRLPEIVDNFNLDEAKHYVEAKVRDQWA